MDNFMDKIAQKISAQEMIRANAEADAAEMKKFQKEAEDSSVQMKQYDDLLQQMRKLNLTNVESADELKKLVSSELTEMNSTLSSGADKIVDESLKKIEEVKVQLESQTGISDEMQAAFDKLKDICEANTAQMKELFKKSEENAHSENVKVYRNVQAALAEEIGRQTEELTRQQKKAMGTYKVLLPFAVLTLIAALSSVGLLAASIFGLL